MEASCQPCLKGTLVWTGPWSHVVPELPPQYPSTPAPQCLCSLLRGCAHSALPVPQTLLPLQGSHPFCTRTQRVAVWTQWPGARSTLSVRLQRPMYMCAGSRMVWSLAAPARDSCRRMWAHVTGWWPPQSPGRMRAPTHAAAASTLWISGCVSPVSTHLPGLVGGERVQLHLELLGPSCLL